MAQHIIFDYERMRNVVNTLATAQENYRKAGNDFITEMKNAMTGWEGKSHDKFQALIDSSNKLLTQDVPDAVLALKTILENNADSMENADAEIADNIPSSI